MSEQMPRTSRPQNLIVRDLGRISYGDAYALQKELQREVTAWRDGDHGGEARAGYLLLVEHDPAVITISRRKAARGNLTANPEQLAAAGVEVAETDRGGDITYHGPGQLVAYPILDLNVLGLRLHGYMRFLEQIVIDSLDQFGIEGHRDQGATGVWVDAKERLEDDSRDLPTEDTLAKICAMGVRITRWVSMHGLALNVMTNLDHFDLIVPCGLTGRGVTSMQELLGESCPSMDEVKRVITERFERMIPAGVDSGS